MRRRLALLLLAVTGVIQLTSSIAGCSSPDAVATVDAADAAAAADASSALPSVDGAVIDAAPSAETGPPVPPLVTAQGGAVLATPKLVTITFSDDPNVDAMEAFGDWVVGSTWLASASEYGVGRGTHEKKVRLGVAAPTTATSTEIRKILTDAMTLGTVPKPASSKDPYLYAVYFPATTTLMSQGLVHCKSFSGYHAEGTVDGVHFAFAAIGDCPHYVGELAELENLQRTASHEIIEASTDPLIESAPGFIASDQSDPWFYSAGEVGDVCSLSEVVRDGTFLAQRYWSNAAAKAGRSPCVPAPPGEYFVTGASPIATQVVAAGASTTFALRGASTMPGAAPWKIQVKPLVGTLAVKTALDTTVMQDGATATLTVTVPADAVSGSSVLLSLYSYRTTDTFSRWPIGIRVP